MVPRGRRGRTRIRRGRGLVRGLRPPFWPDCRVSPLVVVAHDGPGRPPRPCGRPLLGHPRRRAGRCGECCRARLALHSADARKLAGSRRAQRSRTRGLPRRRRAARPARPGGSPARGGLREGARPACGRAGRPATGGHPRRAGDLSSGGFRGRDRGGRAPALDRHRHHVALRGGRWRDRRRGLEPTRPRTSRWAPVTARGGERRRHGDEPRAGRPGSTTSRATRVPWRTRFGIWVSGRAPEARSSSTTACGA